MEESDYEESEEIKKFNEELIKKYNFDKDTKTKYDSNGFDKDGKHKDEDEFLKLYNEIIKNGEFSEKISKNNSVSSYDIKVFLENILNGKVDDNKIIEKTKIINKIENNLNNLKENENINQLKNYIKKIKNSIYGKDKERIRAEQARSFKDQKGKGYIDLPIFLSKMYTNDSSKELINNVKQLINNLYNNK